MPATAPPSWSGFEVRQGYLEADGVALVESARRAQRRAPARTALQRLLVAGRLDRRGRHARRARGAPQAGDDREGVTRVRVDRDPRAGAGLAPLHEAARVQRAVEQRAAVEHVGDAAGAVVAVV